MDVKFQLLDCDYFMNGNSPVLRLFGRTQKGKTVCAFYEGFDPYFYILPSEGNEERVVEHLNDNFSPLLKGVKVVERFLPIGYHRKKTRMLKIILNNPSKVPEVRDEMRNLGVVREVFEADTLFKYRFMSDNGLSGMGWVNVTGNPSNTSTVKTNYKIKASKIEPVEEDLGNKLKYMALDIEVVSDREGLPDSRRDPIAMISVAFSPSYHGKKSMVFLVKPVENSDETVKTFNSEKEMLKEFLRVVDIYDPDIMIGYNINGFDFPYILERFKQQRIPCTLGRCTNKQAYHRTFGRWSRSSAVGRVVVDAYELIKDSASKGVLKLKRYGLGDVSQALLDEDKVDISHSEIEKYWNGDEKKMVKLISYSRKDSVLALKLVLEKNLLDKFLELSKVSGVLLQDAVSGGESTRMETLLLRRFNNRGFVLPSRPTKEETSRRRVERETKALKGAIVLEPETGLHTTGVIYLDFKSMYPSIYISYNICPTTLILGEEADDIVETPYGSRFASKDIRKGIIPNIVEELIKDRDVVKKEMKNEMDEEKRRQLNAKQIALKIMTNAFYGYTGYIRAKLYVLDIANTITNAGRYLIETTRDFVNTETEYTVIYGDTDSVMVKTDTEDIEEAFEIGKKLEKMINEELEGIVKMKIESIFKTLIMLTKKRYAGWSFEKYGGEWEDKIVMKGIETVRRDWCDIVSDTLYRVLEIILKERDTKKAIKFVQEVLDQLKRGDVPIEDLVITKSISKPVRSYKGIQPHVEVVKKMRRRNPTDAPGVGDRIGFVITQGLRLLSNRAEDPDYVKKRGLKIDSKYYIQNQLLPPLERVFESLGIERSELLGEGKQLSLTANFSNISNEKGKKREANPVLDSIDGVICEKCSKTYRRPPLVGKCESCGGNIVFYKGIKKSKLISPKL